MSTVLTGQCILAPLYSFSPFFFFFCFPLKPKINFIEKILLYITKVRAARPGSRREKSISNVGVLAFHFLSVFSFTHLPSLALSQPLHIDNRWWQIHNFWIYISQFKLYPTGWLKSKFRIPRREHLEQFGSWAYLWSSQLW